MSSNSFRKDVGLPPPQYRTPSPPRYAFEPLSPNSLESPSLALRRKRWTGNTKRSTGTEPSRDHGAGGPDQQKNGPQNVMDTFASIALATKSARPPRQEYFENNRQAELSQMDEDRYGERPTKRARSEKLPSPECHRTVSRPITSYVQPSDSQRLEAELLLNFSQGARFATTWVSHPHIPPSKPLRSPPMFGGDYHGLLPYTSAQHQGSSTQAPAQRQDLSEIELSEHNAYALTETARENSGGDIARKTPEPQPTKPTNGVGSSPLPEMIHPKPEGVLQHQDVRVREEITLPQQSIVEKWGPPEEPPSQPQKDTTYMGSPMESGAGVIRGSVSIDDEDTSSLDRKGLPTDLPVQASDIEDLVPPDIFEGTDALGVEGTLMGVSSQQNTTGISDERPSITQESSVPALEQKARQSSLPSVCAACNFTRNSLTLETENNATSWINCDACKSWFHFACAGFKNEREVRSVDKYRCRKCKPLHGSTTYVRKSSRAHSAIDYAGLNEGVLKTSDENPEHHYIKPIKEGIIKFHPETFPRMRPELVTAEYFQRLGSMVQPIVIPASFNPRPRPISDTESQDEKSSEGPLTADHLHGQSVVDEEFSHNYTYDAVPDHGQDALDMVIPQNLTVRKVSELYGPEEKVEVIDVKSQNGEDRKWNMRRWVDYYESRGNKVVRNVISLEVSQSKLGRLIRRPKIVRDLDLQDSVWPPDLQARGDFPKVQFYCLMSVADCFTDFHIDFGGSSVFYHILKGKKTFFFIPPHEKHLKKYEEWCMSPAQNWTFLGDQTKECYRVDLSEGDTMLIPAGWIHAVWTPEDSLVIGGNFLTRMHYGMQIRITQIEKATGVARKFRYPHFQKVLWYAAIRYLEDDPLPDSVMESLMSGKMFVRETPTHHDFDAWGENSKPGSENYHARHYSHAELDGLPELGRYLLRTASIAMGSITEGISTETRNAVKRSIPKTHGEPLDVVKKFAMWYAWKRGNEPIPHWAYPDHVPEDGAPESAEKKLSAKAIRRLDREAALQAYRVAPERQSTRKRIQPQGLDSEGPRRATDEAEVTEILSQAVSLNTTPSIAGSDGTSKRKPPTPGFQIEATSRLPKKRRPITGSSISAPRKPACQSCRKRRRACKHKDEIMLAPVSDQRDLVEASIIVDNKPIVDVSSVSAALSDDTFCTKIRQNEQSNFSHDAQVQDLREKGSPARSESMERNHLQLVDPISQSNENCDNGRRTFQMSHVEIVCTKSGSLQTSVNESMASNVTFPTTPKTPTGKGLSDFKVVGGGYTGGSSSSKSQGRSKACKDCRKSKRRCLHDEDGNEDPVKVREAALPRPTSTSKKRKVSHEATDERTVTKPKDLALAGDSDQVLPLFDDQVPDVQHAAHVETSAPMAVMVRQGSNSKIVATGSTEPLRMQNHAELANQAMQDISEEGQKPHMHPSLHTDGNPPICSSEPSPEQASSPLPEHPLDPNDNPEDEIQLLATSPLSELKFEPDLLLSPNHNNNTFTSQPAATSLVSPPASAHTDAEGTPPASTKHQRQQEQDKNNNKMTPSLTSSRHSSRQPKQVQRYTPESGTVRRESSSTIEEIGTLREGSSGAVSVDVLQQSQHYHLQGQVAKGVSVGDLGGEGMEVQKGARKATRAGSENMPDEDSLRLIRELQAQEYGLRRRGRA